MVAADHHEEFAEIQRTVQAWATDDDDIAAVACVGSWARGEPRPDSDVDVVVLTDSTKFLQNHEWLIDALPGGAALIRTRSWGPLTERRARTDSGLEVDLGFVGRFWATVDPIDAGTRQVVEHGCLIWYDPEQLFERLLAAL